MGHLAFRTLGGTGEDIVLIHGFASDRLSWAATSPALMTAGRLHVLDLPGHGESLPYPGDGSLSSLSTATAKALEAQGVVKAHLVGHSLGGAIALELAATRPALASSLALIAPLGLGAGVDPGFLDELVEATEIEPTLATLRRLVTRPQLINKLLAKRLIDHLNKDGARHGMRRIAAGMTAAERKGIPQSTSRIPLGIRRLVIWGSDDAINPRPSSLPDGFDPQSVIVDGTGHLPHIERPEPVNALLASFLNSR